jgi:hypothetical protein
VASLAVLLDLNSLHNLSRTCRQFRSTLLLYRDQLVTRTLRCENEDEVVPLEVRAELAARYREPRQAWILAGGDSPYGPNGRLTSGKVGKCARDMVAECKRCGTVVCRVSKNERRQATCLAALFTIQEHTTPKQSWN